MATAHDDTLFDAAGRIVTDPATAVRLERLIYDSTTHKILRREWFTRARPLRAASEWDETEHPRDEAGKFTEGPGAAPAEEPEPQFDPEGNPKDPAAYARWQVQAFGRSVPLPEDLAADDPRRQVPLAERRRAYMAATRAWYDAAHEQLLPGGRYTTDTLAAVIHPAILDALRPPQIFVDDPQLELDPDDANVLGRMTVSPTTIGGETRDPGAIALRSLAGTSTVWHEFGHFLDLHFGTSDLTGTLKAPAGQRLIDWERMRELRRLANGEWAESASVATQSKGRTDIDRLAQAKAPSWYALVNTNEWWAENFEHYVESAQGRAWLRENRPHTFEAIDALLSGRLLKNTQAT